MAMESGWTLELDEELRAACARGGHVNLKKSKWWEELAKAQFPGVSGKVLQQRWMHIKNLPGLEYKTFAASSRGSSANGSSAPQSDGSRSGSGAGRVLGKTDSLRSLSKDGRSNFATTSSTAAAKRPFSASSVPRISATRQSAVGQLRGAASASSHTPVLAFSKAADKSKAAPPSPSTPKQESALGGGDGEGEEAKSAERERIGKENGKGDEQNLIVIHVCDENRGINRDFTCRKDVLLTEMAYFRSYLNGSESCDDIDISVHCDIQIFQWLIKYLNEPDSPPPLDTANVISILISSQFLKMSRLVGLCLEFVCANVNEILKMPIDLNCLNQELLTKLSDMLSVDDLDEIVDRKDKLVSRIYMRKLEALFTQHHQVLTRCAFCGQLFATKNRERLVCEKAKMFIDVHGNVIAEHVPSSSWDVNRYLLALRAKRLSWREVYWKVWGVMATMRCRVCRLPFTASALAHCAYCPNTPLFRPGQNSGVYPCCNAPAVRFDTSAAARVRPGCCASNHVIDENCAEDVATMAMLLRRQALVCVPFKERKQEDAETRAAEGSESEDNGGSDEMQEDEEGEYEDSDDEGDVPSRGRHRRERAPVMAAALRKRKAAARRVQDARGGAGRATSTGVTDKDVRQWRQEAQREEDGRRMAQLASAADNLRDRTPADTPAPLPSAKGGLGQSAPLAGSVAGGKALPAGAATPASSLLSPARARPASSSGPRLPRSVPARPATASLSSAKRPATKQALAAKAYGLP